MNRENEIAVIENCQVFRIDAPPGTRIFHGDRRQGIDFDIVCSGGEMLLARHVLDLASKGEKGFSLIGIEPLEDIL